MSAARSTLSPFPRTRRRPIAVVFGLVGALAVTGATPAPAAAGPVALAGKTNVDLPAAVDVAKGLVFDGLRPGGDSGPCASKYEMLLSSGEVACTHGPDPAPEGVDVREPAPVPMVSEEAATALAASTVCDGDGTSGKRVQLVYARASGVADRHSSMLSSFRQWAARIDDIVNSSAAEEGGSRRVRFVHDANCQPTVLNVTLSAAGDDNFVNTIEELRAQGHDRSDRKYLMWVDANVYCGIAQVYTDDRPGQENHNNGPTGIPGMVARVDTGCWGSTNLVEAHELVHTLGSVQPGAPNATAQGHCSDEYDRMCYPDAQGVTMRIVCPSTALENRLDCNGDDYFSTNPAPGSWLASHWNTANSAFLMADVAASEPPTAVRNDFDGNGTTDMAVYRTGSGQWFVKDGNPSYQVWGTEGDIAVAADYTGDGRTDIAVFRPSTGAWHVRGGSATWWGTSGDVPVPGDYDGDGTVEPAVYRPSTGAWHVHGGSVIWWGTSGDIPVPGDYDGNGTVDEAVFRPSSGTWYVHGASVAPAAWGGSQDVPTFLSTTVFGLLGILDIIL